jgi:hypothetical protein
VKSCFNAQTEGVQYYFGELLHIVDNVKSPEPALAYCFQRVEAAQRTALYALLMRKYRTDATVTWGIIDSLDITRKSFPVHYSQLTGHQIQDPVTAHLTQATAIRDRIMHGKKAAASDVLSAVISCLSYATALNAQVQADAGFAPFGKLRGVTSSRKPKLEKDISRLVLKGLGFKS